MISSIDRSLRRHRYKESIMQSPANIFNATKQALKAKQKDLKQKGKGNRPKKADPLSDEEINILFDTGVLGVTSPESILNTVWFNNAIHLGLRGQQEHYNPCKTTRTVLNIYNIMKGKLKRAPVPTRVTHEKSLGKYFQFPI